MKVNKQHQKWTSMVPDIFKEKKMQLAKSLQSKSSVLVYLLVIILALLLVGCNVASSAATETAPPTQVNIQLSWIDTIEYSGFYMAEEKGYFAAENLAVTLNTYDFDKPLEPIEQVAAGKAQFGTASAGGVLLARAEGKPVVAVATIYQRNPSVLISLAEKNITRPQDLAGKKVMIDTASPDSVVYMALMASQKELDPAQVIIVPRTDFSNDLLIKGEVDVMDAYINNQPVQLEKEGYKVNMLIPANYGIDMYANVIITSEEMIAKNPDLVERFVRAMTRGIQSAIDDPKEATTLTAARNKEINFESELESMNRSLPLFNPAGSRPGTMTPEIWASVQQMMLDRGLLKESLEVEKAYTLTFLDKVYSK